MVVQLQQPASAGRQPRPRRPLLVIIITDSQREPYFADYITWQQDHGMSTGIFTTNWYIRVNGNDNADAVRNFFIDALRELRSLRHPLE
jgi:hypothetical protein